MVVAYGILWWLYPLAIDVAMENQHVEWKNSPFLWPCSIAAARLNYQRVYGNLMDKCNGTCNMKLGDANWNDRRLHNLYSDYHV